MRHLFYTFRILIRGRGSNIIKIISLTLGLLVGLILFARIAFELSYDTGYKESDRLTRVYGIWNSGGETHQPTTIIWGPVARTIMEEFPDEVECATTVRNRWENSFFLGEKRHVGQMILGDTLFFRTIGILILSGNIMELAIPDMVFISDGFAKKVFGTTDVIGNTLMLDKTHEITVKGVYKEVSENNSIRPDVVLSFANLNIDGGEYFGWDGGDSFHGYVRLKTSKDIEKINSRINAVIEKYVPYQPEETGWGVRFIIQSIHKSHVDNPNVKRFVMILSFLAISILLIAAFNYILIAISSLARRAKGVGIHKCNGATSGQVLKMFLFETGIIIIIAIFLVILIIINLREIIEEIMDVPVHALFTIDTLWLPVVVIVLVFVVAGVIPGRIFSNIPVTQVFRRYTERNSKWKRILLFVQFSGITFVFGLLIVVFSQYERIMNYDLGYSVERVATASVRFENPDLAKTTIENLPMVESVAMSWLGVAVGYSGDRVSAEDGRFLFSTRFNAISPEFITFYQFRILEGRNVMSYGEVIVNEEYVRRMPWTDGALGKHSGSEGSGTVVGVMKDFVDNTLFSEKKPVSFIYTPDNYFSTISVKIKEPFQENFMALNREIEILFPTYDIVFSSMERTLERKYISVKRFRDSAGIAFIAILFITLMGLIGYVNDEIQRRSKEIAIRKVNGAASYNILTLLCNEVTIIALPAVIIGGIASYFIGKNWLEQFSGTQIELNFAMYVFLAIVIIFIILSTVVLKSWGIANENPVKSIKSE